MCCCSFVLLRKECDSHISSLIRYCKTTKDHLVGFLSLNTAGSHGSSSWLLAIPSLPVTDNGPADTIRLGTRNEVWGPLCTSRSRMQLYSHVEFDVALVTWHVLLGRSGTSIRGESSINHRWQTLVVDLASCSLPMSTIVTYTKHLSDTNIPFYCFLFWSFDYFLLWAAWRRNYRYIFYRFFSRGHRTHLMSDQRLMKKKLMRPCIVQQARPAQEIELNYIHSPTSHSL